MNQKQLHMQPVSSRYLEQYNALLRYVFQVTDQELSSVGWQEKEIIRAKFPTMQKADVIGWFDRRHPGFPGGGLPHAGAHFWQNLRHGRPDGSGNLPGSTPTWG